MSKLLEWVNDLIHVPRCTGCGERMERMGKGICDDCYKLYLDEKAEFCGICGFSANICTCIPHSMMTSGCIDYRKLIFYRKEPKVSKIRNMIFSIKKRNSKHLIAFFAQELLTLDKAEVSFEDNIIVTYAPRIHKSVSKYGYDHGKLLAKEYANAGEYRFTSVFKRKIKILQSQQKLLNYKQRLSNIKDMFSVKDESLVKGKHVIIIDDVVTSGATLGECVKTLYAAGAKSVTCRSIAYTYRKNKQKND